MSALSLIPKFNVLSLQKAKIGGLALATVILAGAPTAHADRAQAKTLLKAMSDYMTSQKTISFDYDSNLEIVSSGGQKLGMASSGTIALVRPDKIRATRVGGFADVELIFDGKQISFVDKENKRFARAEFTGSIESLVDVLRTKHHRPLPAADLILPNYFEKMMPLFTDVKDLGSGVIRGEECDHFAFRTKDVDLQLWITQGEKPHPCRVTIISKKIATAPEYTVDVRNFKSGTEAVPGDFTFKAPEGFREVQPSELRDFDEFPDVFKK